MTTAPTKPSEALRAARELLSDPKRWTKFSMAKNAKKIDVSPFSDEAVCFCSLGALERVSDCPVTQGDASYKHLKKGANRGWVDTWNDDPDTTHRDIIKGFDLAIALAEEVGQ
jgi:hypothetical protein